MNGNDSVVKSLSFFGFLFSLALAFLSCCSGGVTGIVLCADEAADALSRASGWLTDSLGTHGLVQVFIKRPIHRFVSVVWPFIQKTLIAGLKKLFLVNKQFVVQRYEQKQ